MSIKTVTSIRFSKADLNNLDFLISEIGTDRYSIISTLISFAARSCSDFKEDPFNLDSGNLFVKLYNTINGVFDHKEYSYDIYIGKDLVMQSVSLTPNMANTSSFLASLSFNSRTDFENEIYNRLSNGEKASFVRV